VLCQGPELQIEPPTRDELYKFVRTLKNNKLAGEDNISAELY
jgi:hypothetical protein